MTTTQIRQLAQQMFDFAARADRLGCSNDCALLVNIDDNIAPLMVTGGSEDDRNPFFYLATKEQ